MPSKSKKQHNLMALVANNPKAAKRLNIPQSVGEEFMKADKGKKFAKGGMSKHEDVKMDKKVVKKAIGMHDKQLHGGKKTSLEGLKAGGSVKKMAMGGRPIVTQPGPMTGLPKAMGGSPNPKTKPDAGSKVRMGGSMDRMGRMPGNRGYIPTPVMKKGGRVKKYFPGGDVSVDDYVEESVREQKKMDARKKQNEADRTKLEKKYPPKKDVAEDDMPPKDSKGNYIKPRPYKSGGMCGTKKYARGGGIEVRGKTRGKII